MQRPRLKSEDSVEEPQRCIFVNAQQEVKRPAVQ